MTNPNRFRCPECGTRRTNGKYMILHMMDCKRETCDCEGYHFRHRKGSGLCKENPDGLKRHAARLIEDDDELQDVIADIAFHTKGKVSKICPF